MDIIEKDSDLPEFSETTATILDIMDINKSLMHDMFQAWQDSKGEVLDTRIFRAQKLLLDAVKLARDIDPVANKEKLVMHKRAEMASEIAKKLIKNANPKQLAKLAISKELDMD